jgi:hypothetical protein
MDEADVKFHLEFEPSDAGKYMFWKIVPHNGSSVNGVDHGDFEAGKTVEMRLRPTQEFRTYYTDQEPDFTISMGINQDGNEDLAATEAFPLDFQAWVIGKREFNHAEFMLVNRAIIAPIRFPAAAELLGIFTDTPAQNPSWAIREQASIDYIEIGYNMKNGLGCDAPSLNQGEIERYTWTINSHLGREALISDYFWERVQPYITSAMPVIDGWYKNPANSNSNNYIHSIKVNINVAYGDENPDMQHALHSADMDGNITIVTKRSAPKPLVTGIIVSGKITDLYDFRTAGENDEGGWACRLQVCHSPDSGRTRGKIFSILVSYPGVLLDFSRNPVPFDDIIEIQKAWVRALNKFILWPYGP